MDSATAFNNPDVSPHLQPEPVLHTGQASAYWSSCLNNGYRDYDITDVARVQFVAGARSLDFSLDDIQEVLALRDRIEAPCRFALDLLGERVDEIGQRIAELQHIEVREALTPIVAVTDVVLVPVAPNGDHFADFAPQPGWQQRYSTPV